MVQARSGRASSRVICAAYCASLTHFHVARAPRENGPGARPAHRMRSCRASRTPRTLRRRDRARTKDRSPLWGSLRDQVREKCFDTTLDLVADRAHCIDALPGGVVEFPVLVALVREERARVATAHRDDDVGIPHRLGGEHFRLLGGDIHLPSSGRPANTLHA